MITVKQMEMRLDIKDAVEALDEVVEILIGRSYALRVNEGALGQLSKVEKLIQELSPIYKSQAHPDEDFLDTPFAKILYDEKMSNEEKAKKLLGFF